MDRFTVLNPNGRFRVPAERLGDFRIEQSGLFVAVFGDMVDRLGAYEDLLTLQEAKEYDRKRKK